MKVIGLRHGSFTDKRTGEQVNYGRIYVVYPFSDDGKMPDGCVGQKCEELRVKPESLDGVLVGDSIEPVYNRYGKIDTVVVKDRAKKAS